MKKITFKQVVVGGSICLALLLLATWQSVTFNDSRLVVPMNFSKYHFRWADLPMIAATVLFSAYVLTVAVLGFLTLFHRNRQAEAANRTRQLSPKLGLLGFFGFLGFLGFWSYPHSVAPFAFFVFFGFFGFYYEGKMSGTFMDERFRANAARAQLQASRVSLGVIFVAIIVLSQGRFMGHLEYTLMALIIVVSLALALALFLGEYLLYRYDHDEYLDEEA